MTEISSDMEDLLNILVHHRVDFLICGGHALAFHGYVRMTLDLDILVRPTTDNAAKLKDALTEFGFGEAGIPWKEFENEGTAVSLGVQPNQVDILTSVSSQSTDEIFANAVQGIMAGQNVAFINRQDLVRAKKEAGRSKDQMDLEELQSDD